jgi:hypothetical protein
MNNTTRDQINETARAAGYWVFPLEKARRDRLAVMQYQATVGVLELLERQAKPVVVQMTPAAAKKMRPIDAEDEMDEAEDETLPCECSEEDEMCEDCVKAVSARVANVNAEGEGI